MKLRRLYLVLVVGAALQIILMSSCLRMSANPFTTTDVVGEVFSLESTGNAGIILANDNLVLLRLDEGFVGQPPVIGCTIRAHGSYQLGPQGSPPVFVATAVIIETCSKS